MQLFGKQLSHRLSNVTRGFRYRATGGDDLTMPWTELVLVEPPRIIEQEVTLHLPAYLGRAPRLATGSFRVLIGTRATLRGRTSKPLSAASLETDTSGAPVSQPLELDRDQLGFSLAGSSSAWTISQSGRYGVRLVAQDGLDVGVTDSWNVEAIRDAPPIVSWKRPLADLLVTPVAQLALEAIVKDDVAVRTVDLHYVRSASENLAEESRSLWAGPAAVAPPSADEAWDGTEGAQQTVEYVWDLTRMAAMHPGEWIDFRVVAVDYLGQRGESVVRRLSFIGREDLQDRLAERQSQLLAQIAEILDLQRETRSQTAELEIQVREAPIWEQRDMDQLQAVELNQRQVQQRLGRTGGGVGEHIDALVAEAKSNRIDRPDLLNRFAQIAARGGRASSVPTRRLSSIT